jgi:hypothetical protein
MQVIKVVVDRTFVRGTGTGLSMIERGGSPALPMEHDITPSVRSASAKTDFRIAQSIIDFCSGDEREDNPRSGK